MCLCTKGYTDQQLVAGRSIMASFSWLNRESDDYGTHKERRICRIEATIKDTRKSARFPCENANLPHCTYFTHIRPLLGKASENAVGPWPSLPTSPPPRCRGLNICYVPCEKQTSSESLWEGSAPGNRQNRKLKVSRSIVATIAPKAPRSRAMLPSGVAPANQTKERAKTKSS